MEWKSDKNPIFHVTIDLRDINGWRGNMEAFKVKATALTSNVVIFGVMMAGELVGLSCSKAYI